MNIQTDPIHQDILITTLKTWGNSFVDEESRIITMDYFIPVFIYKYGGFLSSWTVRVASDCVRDYIHCENVSGMKFIFPIIDKKHGERIPLSNRKMMESIKTEIQ